MPVTIVTRGVDIFSDVFLAFSKVEFLCIGKSRMNEQMNDSYFDILNIYSHNYLTFSVRLAA